MKVLVDKLITLRKSIISHHAVAWFTIFQPKEARGLGFRQLKDFNQAMLSTIFWDFIQSLEKLWGRDFSNKYYTEHFSHPNKKNGDSYI